MQDRTIDNALLALRKQIIRGNGEGLAHVEALLQARGVAVPRVVVREVPAAKRGGMRLIVLDALRDGPKTLGQIGEHVVMLRPELTLWAARKRASQVLAKMKAAGIVRRDGRMWQSDAANPEATQRLLALEANRSTYGSVEEAGKAHGTSQRGVSH